MKYLARLFGLAAIAALSVPTIPQPGFSQELGLKLASPLLAQADSNSERRAEGDRLLELGRQQYQAGEFQAAIESWQQALEIYREISEEIRQAEALDNLGSAYHSLNNYQQATILYQQSLEIYYELLGEQHPKIAIILDKLAAIYEFQGAYAEALSLYERALEIRTNSLSPDDLSIIANLNSLGRVYLTLSNYSESINYFEQSLAVSESLDDQTVQREAFINLARVYGRSGNYEQALNLYNDALLITQEIGDVQGELIIFNEVVENLMLSGKYSEALEILEFSNELDFNAIDSASVLSNIASIYAGLGMYEKSIDFYFEALAIIKLSGDRHSEAVILNNIGETYFSSGSFEKSVDFYYSALNLFGEGDITGESRVLNNLANVYYIFENYEKAIELLEDSLLLKRKLGDRLGESVSLGNLGSILHRLEQYEESITLLIESLYIKKEVGDQPGQGIVLANIGYIFAAQEKLELAIFFLKQSVNIYEVIRHNNQNLDYEMQQAYANTIAETYRRLADLLLQQDRILEAQRVLDLLKVQELDEYLRDVRGNSNTQTGVNYLRPEAAILARYEERQQSAIALAQELETLKDIAEDQRSEAQNQRIAQLTNLLDEINSSFAEFSRSPEIRALIEQLSYEAREASINLDQLSRQRDELQQLNAAIFYPLILEDRLELVITTPDSPPLRRTVPVTKVELNEAILAFRQALTRPGSDIEAPAQQLYDWLVRPLEDDLAEAGVETIIYAPDGQLRYIPLAALHDGDQWLIQRYRVNNITAASLTDLTKADAAQPRILAAAYTDETLIHTPEVNGTSYTFTGLPGAGLEVETLPAERTFLNQAFSLSAVRPLMDNYTVLHLATHAAFVPGVPEDSFILFGNGDTPTLRDIEGWTLNGVDLVVLSACETGVGGLGNGEEILGLGYTFQSRGAKAVLSSLWQVSDQGTQVLMTAFYNALSQGMTKAEALQQAQMALITGDFSAIGAARAGIGIVNRQTGEAFTAEGLDHPYYWAPFILIGNGL
ncbi:CHAT domain-containing protein [Sphaerothrix gracilis]|uniref:CHAT domain-containing protein n=1 Tax=Sphaerothrix gracilis TaxID=3151835 RepID=UPI0031FCD214